MNMNMTAKVIGLVLLIGGVVIIGWTMFFSFNIFTGKAPAPEIFKTPQEKMVTQQSGSQDIQVQLQKTMEDQLKNMLPTDSIAKILNLTAWLILAWILILGGGQLASIGIKLIK